MLNNETVKKIHLRTDVLKNIMHRIHMPNALVESYIQDIKNTDVFRYKWPIPETKESIVYEFEKHNIDFKIQNSNIEPESGRLFIMFDDAFKLTGIEAEYKIAGDYVFCVKYDEECQYAGVNTRHYRYTKSEIVEKLNNVFEGIANKFKVDSDEILKIKNANYTITSEKSNCSDVLYQDDNGLVYPSKNIMTDAVIPPYSFMSEQNSYFTLKFDGNMNIEEMSFVSSIYKRNEVNKYKLYINKDFKIEKLECVCVKNKVSFVKTLYTEGLSEDDVLLQLELYRLIEQSADAKEILPELSTIGVYDFNSESFNKRIEVLKMMIF